MSVSKISRPSRLWIAPLAAACLTLTGCWQDSAPELLAAGKARMEKREFKPAIIEFKNALQKDASMVEARFLLGKALLESGDPNGAWVELNKVREAGYSNDELVPVMVNTLLLRGQADKFIAEYADVNLTDPKRQAELKGTLAVAYGSKGKYVQARAAADAALKADPGNITAQLAFARLLWIGGDRDAARAQVDQAIAANPKSALPWVLKAEISQSAGSPVAEVMTTYREALKLEPGQMEAQLGVIALLWAQRDFDGVSKQLGDLQKSQPGTLHVRYYNAMLALERKDLKLANELTQELLKLAPESPRFLHLAGMVEYERGGYVQAIAHLSKALPQSNAPIAVRVLLARAQLRAGDPRKAIATVQPLFDAPGTKVPSEVYAVAGDAYLQLGDTENARKVSQLALKLNPQDARSRAALALSDIGEGRTDQGIGALKLLASSNAGIEAEMIIFTSSMRANRLDEAEKVLASIDKKQADKPVAAYLRGQLALRRNQPQLAREQLELAVKRSPDYAPAVAALAALDEEAGKPEQAVARYEKLVAAAPDSVEAVMGLLTASSRAGVKPQDLQAKLDAAIKRFPDAEEPRLGLARLKLDQRDAKAALAIAQEGVARFPASTGFVEVMGMAELQSAAYNQALQAFAKQAAMLPNAVAPLMNVVEVHLARNDAPAAMAQLRKVLALQPTYIRAHVALVQLLMRVGKVDEALTQARTLQAQVPESPAGWFFEGDVQAAKRNLPAAITAYRTSLAKRSASDTAVKLHRTLLAAGQGAEAAKFEAAWVADKPDDSLFNFHLGDQALSREDFERAEGLYRKVLAVKPSDPVTLNNLAWLLHRGGKPGAMEFADKALALAPNSAPLLDTAAEIHSAAGRLDKAMELQKRALDIDPNQPTHRLHYAQLLIKAGQKAQAKTQLTTLKDLGPSFAGQDQVQKLLSTL
jgi:cellulose synthase operon protein C